MLANIRTLQSCLALGRVKVTFILDAPLVVLIGELIGLSFLNYDTEDILRRLIVVVLLGLLRILTVRVSPAAVDEI